MNTQTNEVFKMNMKFKVENPEHSKRIQEELFKLGYEWRGGQDYILDFDGMYYIGTFKDMKMEFSRDGIPYCHHEQKTLADLIEMNKKEDGLISGKEAFKAWYNGDKIEVCYIPHNTWVSFNENTYGIPVFKSKDHKFRLKPKTVTINGIKINKCRSIENDRQSHEVTIEFKNQDDADKYHDLISKLFFYS